MAIILQEDFSTDANWGFAAGGGATVNKPVAGINVATQYLYVITPKKGTSGSGSAAVAEAVDILPPRSEFDATFTYGTEKDYTNVGGDAGYVAFLLISDAAEAVSNTDGSPTDGLYIRVKSGNSGILKFGNTEIGTVSPIVGGSTYSELIHKYRVQVADGRVKTKGWLAADPEPEEWGYDLDISAYAVGSGNFGIKAVNNYVISSGTYTNRLGISDLTISEVVPEGPPAVDDAVDLETSILTALANEATVSGNAANYTLSASRAQNSDGSTI